MKHRAGLWTLLLVATMAGRAAAAQDRAADQASEHTVRPGDTLWSLARLYLNDPFLWPEIYRLNAEVVEDPHWIYPGERLALPEGARAGAGAVLAGAGGGGGSTVFARATDGMMGGPAGSVRADPPMSSPPLAVRPGEVIQAPFLDRVAGPPVQGRILGSADADRVRPRFDDERYQLNDEVNVAPPRGIVPLLGDRYMTASLGPKLERGRVVVPTGILLVTGGGAGIARARLVEQFDRVDEGQILIPLDTALPPVGARARQVADGPAATVIHIHNNPVLPSIQRYLLLDATSAQGIKVGDEFSLYAAVERKEGDPRSPDEVVAIAQVVRVTAYGTTAIIIDQAEPTVRTGMRARLTARMP